MTRKQLVHNAAYQLHHASTARGYVSRKTRIPDIVAVPYEGRYGEGYTVDCPNWRSTRYGITREYWILREVA